MHVLSVTGLTKSVEGRTLFEDLRFGLDDGDRVGLVGANGAGKSTLLDILAGVQAPDAGRVAVNSDARISYLRQGGDVDAAATALDAVLTGPGVARRLEADPALRDDPAAAAVAATALLDRLGIADTGVAVGSLSGGLRRRVALAGALLGGSDLLILDEPTNHLDADTVEWLESELARRRGGLLVVTHDRYLLERLCTRMLELDAARLYRHEGRYSDLLEARARRQEAARAAGARRRNLLRKEIAWLRRGARARTSKPRFRLAQVAALAESGDGTGEAPLQLGTGRRRLGNDVFDLAGVTKSFGPTMVLHDVDLVVGPGDRVGIVGPNGAGKTTLLYLLAGQCTADDGTIRVGRTVEIGYYEQELTVAEAGERSPRAIDVVREVAEWIPLADGRRITASALLERFNFDDALQHRAVALLSGGERRRLALCRVLMAAPNVLLFDEPTNDLDLDTLAALEDHLDAFAGTIVVASHDRYLLDRVCDVLYGIEPGGTLRKFPGEWAAYREMRAKTGASAGGRARDRERAARHGARQKTSYKHVRELAQLEAQLPALERRRDSLAAEVADATSDYQRLLDLSAALDAVSAEIDAAETRWLELSDLVDP